KFLVRESNPELDIVRPDFAAMYQMAGEFDEIASRLEKSVADKVRVTLARRKVKSDKPAGPAPGAPADADKPADGGGAPKADSPRLYFDLKTAGIIPELMTQQTKVQRNRGPVDDLWDDGPTLGHDNRGQPIMVPWMLGAVVGLFSLEW